MPRVLIPLAEGCEELEAVTLIDLLRRAEIDVVAAGLDGETVRCSRGTVIVPDAALSEALREDYDMVVLPGGMPGAQHLEEDERVCTLLKQMVESGKFAGAICAAPKVLARCGLLEGKRATAYPGFMEREDFPGVENTGAAVERDGKIITGRGPGAAIDFALEIIEALTDKDTRNAVEAGLVRS